MPESLLDDDAQSYTKAESYISRARVWRCSRYCRALYPLMLLRHFRRRHAEVTFR